MSIQKAKSSINYRRYGAPTIRNNNSTGESKVVDRWTSDGRTEASFDPNNQYNLYDATPQSWACSGLLVDPNGVVLFNAATNGGNLCDLTISNRGPGDLLFALNGSGISNSGAYPIISGQTIKFDQSRITNISVRAAVATSGIVTAIGLYDTIIR